MSYHFTSVLPLTDGTAMCTTQLSIKGNRSVFCQTEQRNSFPSHHWLMVWFNIFCDTQSKWGKRKSKKRKIRSSTLERKTVAVHDLKRNQYIKLLFWFSWWFVCVCAFVCVIHFSDLSCVISLVPLFSFALFCITGFTVQMNYSHLLKFVALHVIFKYRGLL